MPLDGKEADYTTPSTDTESVLLRAAEIIRERGLHKGSYGRLGHPLCALGAIHEAERGCPFMTEAASALQRLLFRRGIDLDIARWNDAPERTAEDVISALRAAAQHSRAEGHI